jgi:lambda family phage portal protein
VKQQRQATTWVDRQIIARISPAWAVRRARARQLLNAYEATSPSRYRRPRKDRASANATNERSVMDLRSLARNLEENLDIAKGALDVLVANVVGAGIAPEPQVELLDGEPATDLNRALMELWADWIKTPEVTHSHDYWGLQRLIARSWLRDGDVFSQHLMGPVAMLDHGTVLPYSLEALEGDFVPVDLSDERRGIVQGVELNKWGRARAYHIYKAHPGDRMTAGMGTKRVPADRMSHLKMVLRLHQVRGVSVFASALARLDDIKEIDESERVAARVAAAMAAYIKKGTPDVWVGGTDPDTGETEKRELEFLPGTVIDDLMPGEDIGTINTSRPNNALIPFRDSQLRAAAAGIGGGFSSIAKNYDGTYSAQRQELVEQFVQYRMMTGGFVMRFAQPVWDRFVMTARLSGAVEIPADVNERTLLNVSHALPPMPWIDPVKEGQANEIAEDRGWKSRSGIIRERGGNPDQVNREIKQDQDERARLGLDLNGGRTPVEPDAPAPESPAKNARTDRLRVATRK